MGLVITWYRRLNQKKLLVTTGASVVFAAFILTFACTPPKPRVERSYDEIKALVAGKTAAEVMELLGEPDTRRELLDEDEKWIWWNYTFLAGNDYPPEVRGEVVHLEVLFRSPSTVFQGRASPEEWRVDENFDVTYELPAKDKTNRF